MTIFFKIPGKAMGKGRPRSSVQGGRIHTYTPSTTRDYEDRVRLAYKEAARGFSFETSPVTVEITANFNVARLKKPDRQIALSGALVPQCKPDGDNIAKIVLDALNGLAYQDDKQVYDHRVIKRYADEDSVTVLLRNRKD